MIGSSSVAWFARHTAARTSLDGCAPGEVRAEEVLQASQRLGLAFQRGA
jgi:hypothetical protein